MTGQAIDQEPHIGGVLREAGQVLRGNLIGILAELRGELLGVVSADLEGDEGTGETKESCPRFLKYRLTGQRSW